MEIQFTPRNVCKSKFSLIIIIFILNIFGCFSNNLAKDENKPLEENSNKKISSIMSIEIDKKDENFIKDHTTFDTFLMELNFKNITGKMGMKYKNEYKLDLYNEQSFHTTITKFKIASNKLIYLNYTEIKDRVLVKSKKFIN